MPNRRKTKEELREEALGSSSNADSDSDASRDVPFEALSDDEQSEINDLFVLLHTNGYETAGGYSVSTEGPDDATLVTLSAILPATNDWDPASAYEEAGDE